MSVRSLSVRSVLGAARRRVQLSLQRRPARLRNGDPIVSFTFDDFPRTAYTAGGRILEQFGVRGTFYAAYGLRNTANESGEQFRAEDVELLLEKGHELGSHTFGHVSCRALSRAAFCEDVTKGNQAIAGASGVDAPNFAYPFGHMTVQTKRALGSGVASARSNVPGFNGPEIDLNMLLANRLYGGIDQARRMEELIAENAKRKTWLIFYTHDVQPNPSPYGCTPALFEATVACAVRHGCRILTVQKTLEYAEVQDGKAKGHVRRPVSA
jgi:peptidoglycan/xylan/chitin deacetylase (PgdA/CDA1 family)